MITMITELNSRSACLLSIGYTCGLTLLQQEPDVDVNTIWYNWNVQQNYGAPRPVRHATPAPEQISPISTLQAQVMVMERPGTCRPSREVRIEAVCNTIGVKLTCLCAGVQFPTMEWEILPYVDYDRGRPTTAGIHVVDFRRRNGQELALSDALRRNCDDLVNGDVPALPLDVSAKISVRLEVIIRV